ncbi:MAG: hypothetical protein ACLPSW_28105 [Roseiarcus sp.]
MEELTLISSNEQSNPMVTDNRYGNRARVLFEPLLIHQGILHHIIDAQLGEWIGVKLFDLRDPVAIRDRALIRRQQLPEREKLHGWDDELCRVLDGEADEKTLSFLVATMLDGFPRGMVPNVRTYVEGTLIVIGDHALAPEILAAAIVRIWRKNRFPPTIAELLDECDHARQRATSARRVVTKMLAMLDNAEEALIATRDFDEARRGSQS